MPYHGIGQAAARGRPPGPRSAAEVRNMRILLVEDDEKIAAFVANGLREAGFAVDCTEDGEQALHMALAVSYDAAVVDIMRPRLDGLSLISTLRSSRSPWHLQLLEAPARYLLCALCHSHVGAGYAPALTPQPPCSDR